MEKKGDEVGREHADTMAECPVCFQSFPTTSLGAGPCQHSLCLQCAKHLVLAPQSCTIPGFGRCPICRGELSIFDFVTPDPVPPELIGSLDDDEAVRYTKSVFSFCIVDEGMLQVRLADRNAITSQPKPTRYYAPTKCLDVCDGLMCFTFSDDYGFTTSAHYRDAVPSTPTHSSCILDGMWRMQLEENVWSRTFQVRQGMYYAAPDRPVSIEELDDGTVERSDLSDTTGSGRWRLSLSPSQLQLQVNQVVEWTRGVEGEIDEVEVEVWEYKRPLSEQQLGTTFRPSRTFHRSPPIAAPPISYASERLMGNTFVQMGGLLGLASYHFPLTDDNGDEATDRFYISYQHQQAVTKWPPLDDGRPIPARMLFTETSMDGTVFRGVIDWFGTFQTTWLSSRRWEYEIHFDDKFLCILRGTVLQGDGREPLQFGEELVYVNAALMTSSAARAAVSVEHLVEGGASATTLQLLRQAMGSPIVSSLGFEG